MSDTFTPVTAGEKRDPNEFIPWNRVTEMNTPRGMRPGKLLVVRPLKVIEEWRPEEREKWLAKGNWVPQLTVIDVAVLDAIEPAADEYGTPLPGFPAGHQFRDNTVFPGFLNKAFNRYVGKTLIGTVYLGPNTKGKPPVMWRDLSGDPQAIARGQGFMAAHPEFLIPREAAFTQATPEVWHNAPETPGGRQASGGYSGYPNNPNAPQQGSHPAMYTQHDPRPPQQYQQDPWANATPVSAQPVSPAQPHPNQGMSTLDQLRQDAAQAMNHHGQPQSTDAPF